MSASSVVTVPCDRCGRRRRTDEASDAPFSFCESCGLFVCSTCWSRGESVCDACSEARSSDASAPRTRSRRKARGGRAKRGSGARAGSDHRAHVTSLHASTGVASRTAAAETGAGAISIAPRVDEGGALSPVGPGAVPTEDEQEAPRWARRLPEPFVVRLANRLTDGHAFALIVATLIGFGILAAAWALAVGMRLDADAAPLQPGGVEQGVLSSRGVAPTATPATSPSEGQRRYFVRSGDTLAKIADRVYGDESLWPRILEANRDVIHDPDSLVTGTNLWIPPEPAAP